MKLIINDKEFLIKPDTKGHLGLYIEATITNHADTPATMRDLPITLISSPVNTPGKLTITAGPNGGGFHST